MRALNLFNPSLSENNATVAELNIGGINLSEIYILYKAI